MVGARSVIHPTSVVAVHVHSGCALIATLVVPPAAAIVVSAFATVTWHFAVDGPVELSELDVHAIVANSAEKPSAAIARPMVAVIRVREWWSKLF